MYLSLVSRTLCKRQQALKPVTRRKNQRGARDRKPEKATTQRRWLKDGVMVKVEGEVEVL